MRSKTSVPLATTEAVPKADAPSEQKDTPIEELIRMRAFQLYEERGRIEGHAEEDWLQAECDILSRQSGKAA